MSASVGTAHSLTDGDLADGLSFSPQMATDNDDHYQSASQCMHILFARQVCWKFNGVCHCECHDVQTSAFSQ